MQPRPLAHPRPRALPVLAALGALLASACTQVATPPEVTPLVGGWQYRWGDSPVENGLKTWASEPWEAPGWTEVALPGAPAGRPPDTRHLWVRYRLPAPLPDAATVYLQWVDQNVEAYLGGQPFYRFGEPDFAKPALGTPSHFLRIPTERAGAVLALRVYSNQASAGPLGALYLGEERSIVRRVLQDGLPVFVVGLVLIALAFASLGILVFNRQNQSVRFLAALGFVCGLYSLTSVYSPVKNLVVPFTEAVWVVEVLSLFLIPGCFFGFYASIAEERHRRVAQWMWRVNLGYTVLSGALYATGLVHLGRMLDPGRALLAMSMLLGLGLAGWSTFRGRRQTLLFLLGLSAAVITGVHDLLVNLNVLRSGTVLMFWGFLVFFLCLAAYVLADYASILRERAGYATELQQRNVELNLARQRIEEVSERLAQQAESLLQAATHQTALADQQAAANQRTSSTVSEIAATSRTASAAALSVVDGATRSAQLNQQGVRVVGDAVAAMDELGGQVTDIANSVAGFSTQTLQIGEILATVSELAEQSNLLALNAALEAAQAGSGGRGFGVVAHEMRRLASQSKGSVTRIRALVAEIQKGTRGAVEATERGSRSAQRATGLVREAGEAISSLSQVIQDSARVAQQIAQTSQEQTAGVDHIVEAIAENAEALHGAAAGVRQMEEAARELASLSKQLSRLSQNAQTQI